MRKNAVGKSNLYRKEKQNVKAYITQQTRNSYPEANLLTNELTGNIKEVIPLVRICTSPNMLFMQNLFKTLNVRASFIRLSA